MLTPVLEVGGTHVSGALVNAESAEITHTIRLELDNEAPARQIISTLTEAARWIQPPHDVTWGIAIPDPFDYPRGLALFRGVGKFESLYGIDMRTELHRQLPGPRAIIFVNDADAFALGESRHGTTKGHSRSVGITLGTGVGSGWICDRRIVTAAPGLPPGGRAHLLKVNGVPLEQVVSRAAIRMAYAARCGSDADVREIALHARAGQPTAVAVLSAALRRLGMALAPSVLSFGAEAIAVGGSMARSWALFEPWFVEGFSAVGPVPPCLRSNRLETAPLLGAALAAADAPR